MPEQAPQDRRRRVMVVDNDPDVAGLLRDFLEATGFETHVAVDGLAGLNLLDRLQARHLPVDLIVLDQRMPELDGRAFLTRLAGNSTRHPPVIVISGFIDDHDHAYYEGNERVCGILEKPFDLGDLERLVREAAAVDRDESPGLWNIG